MKKENCGFPPERKKNRSGRHPPSQGNDRCHFAVDKMLAESKVNAKRGMKKKWSPQTGHNSNTNKKKNEKKKSKKGEKKKNTSPAEY
jgi:hypothetical protein